jgi:hypothetical protein
MLHSQNRFAMTITAGLTQAVAKEEMIILEYNLVILVWDGLGVNLIIRAGKLVTHAGICDITELHIECSTREFSKCK